MRRLTQEVRARADQTGHLLIYFHARRASAYSVLKASDDFPEPEPPGKHDQGISRNLDINILQICSRAPRTLRNSNPERAVIWEALSTFWSITP